MWLYAAGDTSWHGERGVFDGRLRAFATAMGAAMTDIRYCLLLGTVFFIAGNSVGSSYWRRMWHVGGVVFWIATFGIGFGLTK